mgnify:CR=1 FL=1
MESAERGLLEIGVQFDLVEARQLAGLVGQPLQVLIGEVRDPHGPHPAAVAQLQQRTPRLDILSAPGRWPMEEEEVEDVESAIATVWCYSAKRPRTHSTKPADEHGSQQSMLSPHAPGSVQLAAIVRRQEAVSTARCCSSFFRQLLLILFLAPSRLGCWRMAR